MAVAAGVCVVAWTTGYIAQSLCVAPDKIQQQPTSHGSEQLEWSWSGHSSRNRGKGYTGGCCLPYLSGQACYFHLCPQVRRARYTHAVNRSNGPCVLALQDSGSTLMSCAFHGLNRLVTGTAKSTEATLAYLLPCLDRLLVNRRASLHLRTFLECYHPWISDKEDFKPKQVRRGKEGHYISIKRPIHQIYT